MHVELSEKDRDFLLTVLDYWADGMEDATKEVERDPTFEDVDELTRAVGGMVEDFGICNDLRSRLRGEMLPL